MEKINETLISSIVTNLLADICIDELPVASISLGERNMFDTENKHYFLIINQERFGYTFDILENKWITYESRTGNLCKTIGILDVLHQERFMKIYEIMNKHDIMNLRCISYNKLTGIDEWVYFLNNDNTIGGKPYYIDIKNGVFSQHYQ